MTTVRTGSVDPLWPEVKLARAWRPPHKGCPVADCPTCQRPSRPGSLMNGLAGGGQCRLVSGTNRPITVW